MTHASLTRYDLQLDVLERNDALSDPAAIALLRSEFALAINASYFSLLTDEDIAIEIGSREIPQDGVARYAVALELAESTPAMTDEQVAELLRREFSRALNASHFIRITGEDVGVGLVARSDAAAPVAA